MKARSITTSLIKSSSSSVLLNSNKQENKIVKISNNSISSSSTSLSSATNPTESRSDKDYINRSDDRTKKTMNGSISMSEIDHFNKFGSKWWNENDSFGLLHQMNPVRVQFIKERLIYDYNGLKKRSNQAFKQTDSYDEKVKFLKGLKILDVGCGGGLFSEVLFRLGGKVLGIDASEESFKAAQNHLDLDPQLRKIKNQSRVDDDEGGSLEYLNCSVEDLLSEEDRNRKSKHFEKFDLVCAMEVIEHVNNPPTFLKSLIDLTKPGGQIILSTISRTPISNILTIKIAESNLPFLGIVPKDTHSYEKFIKPIELETFFRNSLFSNKNKNSGSGGGSDSKNDKNYECFERTELEHRGCYYNPILKQWSLFDRDSPFGELCNYFFAVKKPFENPSI